MQVISHHLYTTAILLKRFKLFCDKTGINETEALNSKLYENTITLKHHLDILVDKPLTFLQRCDINIKHPDKYLDLTTVKLENLINRLNLAADKISKIEGFQNWLLTDKPQNEKVKFEMGKLLSENRFEIKTLFAFYHYNLLPEFYFHKTMIYINIKKYGMDEIGKTNFMRG